MLTHVYMIFLFNFTEYYFILFFYSRTFFFVFTIFDFLDHFCPFIIVFINMVLFACLYCLVRCMVLFFIDDHFNPLFLFAGCIQHGI